ncbi:MAG: LTA synthase family protein [Rhodanobacter sp.]
MSRRWSVAWIRPALLLLSGILLVWWLDPALPGSNVGLLWRNALPVSVFALLLFGLSGRVLLSIWLAATTTWLVFLVNGIKERQMNAPLMPGDWVVHSQLLHNISFFSHYTGKMLPSLLGMVVFCAATWIVWRCERRWARPKPASRILLTLLSLGLLYTAYRGERPFGKIYSDDQLAGYQPWDPISSVQSMGLMAALVRMTQEARIRIPKADEAEIADFAKAHAVDLNERFARKIPAELPDIVVVQSEAFFDPGIMKGINLGDFAPNFERLAASGLTGSLETPTYGGGTIRTEFETLTGYPMLAFPSIVYPYYGLVRKWMPSVPRRLRSFGYSTTLFHPFHADFWNRQEVMPELGFEHSFYESDFGNAARAGFYISDQALYDFVLSHLPQAGASSYSLVITMENHGPWSNDLSGLPHALDGHPLPAGLGASGKQEMTYYLSHLVNGDTALGDFASKLMARKRWTVLLFYGDHLPSLDDAFNDIGFDDGKNYAYQHTRYMLISNRPLAPARLDLSAYDLPGLLFDTLKLPEDGYMAFDGAIRKAAANDSPEQDAHYGQISFNAALMEVRCEKKLGADGKCKKGLL